MNADQKRLISPQTAAMQYGVSRTLIYQWCDEGLPHYRLGGQGRRGKIAIDPRDLDVWIEAKKVIAGTPARPSSLPIVGAFSELDSERLLKAWAK